MGGVRLMESSTCLKAMKSGLAVVLAAYRNLPPSHISRTRAALHVSAACSLRWRSVSVLAGNAQRFSYCGCSAAKQCTEHEDVDEHAPPVQAYWGFVDHKRRLSARKVLRDGLARMCEKRGAGRSELPSCGHVRACPRPRKTYP
jgi:hypothetical protein